MLIMAQSQTTSLIRQLMLFLLIRASSGDVDEVFPCGSCSCNKFKGGTSADCSNKGFLLIPQDLPSNILGFDLSHNSILSLSNGLQRYGDLRKLNVSYNEIKMLDEDDFAQLFNLTVLDLSCNHLRLDNYTYPKGLFRHQQNLFSLKLHHNSDVEGSGLEYPDQTFSNLISLEYLSIDGLRNAAFGQGFQNLVQLKTLILEGNCDIRTLRNYTFRYVPFIEYLSVSNCALLYIEPAAFQPMRGIRELELSDNVNLGIPNFGVSLYGLQNSSIRILRGNSLNTHHGVGLQVRLGDVQYLRNTQLEELHFNGNRVELLDAEVVSNLPTTLKRMSAKDNMLLFGMYLLTASTLTDLEWGDASWQHQSYATPFSVKEHVTDRDASLGERHTGSVRSDTYHSQEPSHLANFASFGDIWPGNFTVNIPPNMTFANVSHSKLNYVIRKIQFGPNILKSLDLSYNFFTRWEGPIVGFDTLEYIDLSHNYCDYVSDKMTMYLSAIKTINVSSNYLGYSLTDRTLYYVKTLEVLDMSNNKINELPNGILDSLTNLKNLYLSSNYLSTWDVDIRNMINLTELDLSNNLFDELPKDLEYQLTAIRNPNLRIHIHNNPLKCTCKTLSSLRWIHNEGTGLINFKNASCTFPDGSKQALQNLPEILLELEKLCAYYLGIMFGILSFVILTVAILISGLVYRYRWKLRYLYYLTINKHRGYVLPQDEEQPFEFDAFVSYADEDRGFIVRDMRQKLEEHEEEDCKLRLCIHHRDFLPGEAIAANILKAINASRKTVVILTRNFLKSYWCRYEVEMAKMESIYRGRTTLLIVVMEDIPVKDLPVDIVEVMRNDSYVEFTNDTVGQEVFWLNIRRAIRN